MSIEILDTVTRPTTGNWLATAANLSKELKASAVERERQNQRPIAELKKLRETGLVNLLIPKRFGGEGGTLSDAAAVVVELCRGDASVGALLAFHYYVSSVPRLFDFIGDAEAIQRKSAANRWLWGNVHQPLAKPFRAEPRADGGFILNGIKPWNTGPSLGDVTTVIAPRTDRKEVLFAYIPTDRKGLIYHNDWDHLGLRLTDTVTITFDDVEVKPDEVIHSTQGKPVVFFPPLYSAHSAPLYAAIFLGSALGAFESGREYTLTKTRPRPGTDSAQQDPYILAEYGEIWTKLRVGLTYLDKVTQEVQAGYDRRRSLTDREIAELEIKARAIRAFAAEVGLEVTPKIYELTGARAAANSYGFDRYWRDIRTLSLHDPMIHSVKTIGNYALNDKVPERGSWV